MSNLSNSHDVAPYDNLINQGTPVADVFHVHVKEGLGVLKRGTVLANDPDIENVNAELTPLGPDGIANCILADDADTETSTLVRAYRTGHFNRGALIVADGYQLNESNEEDLRKRGILLSDAFK